MTSKGLLPRICPPALTKYFSVKKEILIAGLIGLVIGLTLVGLYIILIRPANSSAKVEMYNPLVEDYLLVNNSKIKFSNGQDHKITLIAPADQSVTNTNQISVAGRSTPESIVIIMFETGEKSLFADIQGDFETSINLISGENEIKIIAYSPSGLITNKTLTVVVSSFEF